MSDATPYITFNVNSRPSLWKRLAMKTVEPHDVVSVNVPEYVTSDWNMSLDENGKKQVKSKRQVLHVYSASRQYMELYRVNLSIKNTINLLFESRAGVFSRQCGNSDMIRFQQVTPIEAGVIHNGQSNQIIGYAWIEGTINTSEDGLFGGNGIIVYKNDLIHIDTKWFPVIKDVMQQLPAKDAAHVLVDKNTDIIASSNINMITNWLRDTHSNVLAKYFTHRIFKSLTQILSMSTKDLKTTTVVLKTLNEKRKVECKPVFVGKTFKGYMITFTTSPETKNLISSFRCTSLQN